MLNLFKTLISIDSQNFLDARGKYALNIVYLNITVLDSINHLQRWRVVLSKCFDVIYSGGRERDHQNGVHQDAGCLWDTGSSSS